MKILHTIEGMGAKFGGIATCTDDLVKAINNAGGDVVLLSPTLRDVNDVQLGDGESWSVNFENDGIGPFNYSRNSLKWLDEYEFDVYHANGMWQHIVHATCAKARKEGRPYVLTPHGMLYRHALRISRWKKWPMRKLWFDKDILKANCIHVACDREMEEIRAFGYKGPVAVIGNPVSVPSYIDSFYNAKKTAFTSQPSQRTAQIGLLARLHPIKGIENLIKATAKVKECRLILMGGGDGEYTAKLHSLVESLGIVNRVEFAGFVSGQEKFRRLAELDALFVPSDMENFGMIVPEALLVGTPVMASKGTPWEELETRGCGWWRDNSPEEIAKVIEEVSLKSPQELFEMGSRGRELVLEKYEASKVAKQMIELYRWLLGEASKPDFVYLD